MIDEVGAQQRRMSFFFSFYFGSGYEIVTDIILLFKIFFGFPFLAVCVCLCIIGYPFQ